ncbi:hypothetical protein ES703_92736 [subsurface metagenome]
MKKAMGMFVALILALGMSGLAYATWSETLMISGTVNTGTVDVEWSEVDNWDNEAPGKDVSWIACEIDVDDPNLLHVTVTNAYPSIGYYNEVVIHNAGTIPVHIYDVVVSNPNPDKVEVDISYQDEMGDPIEPPVQLHPCDEIYAVIHVHLTQDAEMDTTYDFSAAIIAVQWNMLPD